MNLVIHFIFVTLPTSLGHCYTGGPLLTMLALLALLLHCYTDEAVLALLTLLALLALLGQLTVVLALPAQVH